MTTMSKYAVTAPIKILKALQEKGLLGDYNLLLGHDVLNNPSEYQQLLKKIPSSGLTILDNSTVELGSPLDNQDMVEAAQILDTPLVITLPDVLSDVKNTLEMSGKAAVYYGLEYVKKQFKKPVKFMGVVQGANFSEIGACTNVYEAMRLEGKIDILALPRVWTNTPKIGTRRIVGYISCNNFWAVHLLGMSENLNDDIASAKSMGTMGIDSANPIVLGWKDIPISSGLHIPRGNFWDECQELTPMIEDNVRWVRNQII